MTAMLCVTCRKPCYPTEKVMVSDLWVHKGGCLKCSVCSTTLSLSSVYVAAPSESPGERALFCARDVPKVVHTSIVDSLALRTAMNAPNPISAPKGAFASKKKTSGKSIRFKGLTLRSKSIKAGMEAPKLDLKGLMKTPIVVGQAPGSALDSWDIAHAMSVQNQVSSPIRDHPAIHAQRTGSSAGQWSIPSQPLAPQMTGASESSQVSKAGQDDEGVTIKPDLVKNLIKVFQLDAVDRVMLDPPTPSNTPVPAPRRPRGHAHAPTPTDSSTASGPLRFANYAPTVSMHGSMSIKSLASKGDAGTMTLRILGTLGSRRGTVSHRRTPLAEVFGNPPMPEASRTPGGGTKPRSMGTDDSQTVQDAQNAQDARKAIKLLEKLLPLAAHLIPLPGDEDEDEHHGEDRGEQSARGDARGDTRYFPKQDAAGPEVESNGELDTAREELVRGLEQEGLELVMVFEEEPLPFSTSVAPELN